MRQKRNGKDIKNKMTDTEKLNIFALHMACDSIKYGKGFERFPIEEALQQQKQVLKLEGKDGLFPENTLR